MWTPWSAGSGPARSPGCAPAWSPPRLSGTASTSRCIRAARGGRSGTGRPGCVARPAVPAPPGRHRAGRAQTGAAMTVRLEPLRRKDLARCAELERVLYAEDDPWSESIFRSELDAGHLYL